MSILPDLFCGQVCVRVTEHNLDILTGDDLLCGQVYISRFYLKPLLIDSLIENPQFEEENQ
jgi:hypothetical protein